MTEVTSEIAFLQARLDAEQAKIYWHTERANEAVANCDRLQERLEQLTASLLHQPLGDLPDDHPPHGGDMRRQDEDPAYTKSLKRNSSSARGSFPLTK